MNSLPKIYWIKVAPLLVFSGMGVFSFLLLLNHNGGNLGEMSVARSAMGLVVTILLVNLLGFATLLSGNWLITKYPLFYSRQGSFIAHLIFVGLILWLFNISLFFGLKYLINPTRLFEIRSEGFLLLTVIWFVEIIILSLMLTIYSLKHALRLIKEKQQLEEDSLHARFIALQNQLNPHFLFNSLNALIAEIDYDPEVAIQFTQNLSDVYRYTLQQQENFTVSLKEEVEFLDAFIFLHQVRLGDGLEVKYLLDEADYSYRLPTLALQILAENVIKHNYIDRDNPMTIELSVNRDRHQLIFKNTLRPKKREQISGKGLTNLRERYKLLCDRELEVEVHTTRFIVTLPLLYE